MKGNNFFRIIFYIPNILSIVVIAGIFSAVYDPSTGLLNNLLAVFKLEKPSKNVAWRSETLRFTALAVHLFGRRLATIWSCTCPVWPVSQKVSMKHPALEGAGRITQFFSITLPLIWNNIRTTLTFFIISTINLSFLLVQAMTGGGPDGSTEVFLSYMYKQAYTNSSYGYGMAIGVVIFLILLRIIGDC